MSIHTTQIRLWTIRFKSIHSAREKVVLNCGTLYSEYYKYYFVVKVFNITFISYSDELINKLKIAIIVFFLINYTLSFLLIKNGKLSEILFIQADNCARENKNKYVLAFCELLVKLRVFYEVSRICFHLILHIFWIKMHKKLTRLLRLDIIIISLKRCFISIKQVSEKIKSIYCYRRI